MKLRFWQPARAEQAVNADPFSLFDVSAGALLGLVTASYRPKDIFPGFVTSYSEGGVSVQKDVSPAVGERVTLHQSPEGTWTLNHQIWRPGTERELQGESILTTSNRPVSPTEPGIRETEVCFRRSDGSVITGKVTEVAVLQPMTVEECTGYTQTLQDLVASARR